MVALIETAADLDDFYARHHASHGSHTRGVVMTMGALHDGHAALMIATRERIGPHAALVVTDFVNPTQFAAGEDFDRYPRTLDHDLKVCAAAGVDAVFAPSVAEVYGSAVPASEQVAVDPGALGDELEGAARPGHFRGVLTVVAKLLHLTAPDLAAFGEKDYQQLVLISRMVDELRFRATVLPVPTVREADGLAMSSRNRFLDPAARASAILLSRALYAAQDALADGASADDAERVGCELLARDAAIDLDYLVVRSASLTAPVPGPVRILVAAHIGGVRLIDNVAAELRA